MGWHTEMINRLNPLMKRKTFRNDAKPLVGRTGCVADLGP